MSNFHIDTDKIAIGRINESLSTLQQARDLHIREAEVTLKSADLSYYLLFGATANAAPRAFPDFCDNVSAAHRDYVFPEKHRSCVADS